MKAGNNQREVLAIIPARGCSKQIPEKNIAIVAGKPLIEWTFLAARESKYLTRIIVSTDSNTIADISRKLGAEVPFIRPEELARDDTPGMLPVLHALRLLIENDNYQPEYVILLQPTSPLRTTEDIDAAIELLISTKCDAVVSVSPVEEHPYWMKTLDDSGRMMDFLSMQESVTRRQDLPPIYRLNGAIYLARSKFLLEEETWFSEKTFGYVMPAERSFDIDSPLDLSIVELLLEGSIEV